MLISHSTCLSVQTRTKGACVDSGAQTDVNNSKQYAIGPTGKSFRLGGILATAANAVEEICGFQTVTDKGKSVIQETEERGLLLSSASDCILSLALMIKSGCNVNFRWQVWQIR